MNFDPNGAPPRPAGGPRKAPNPRFQKLREQMLMKKWQALEAEYEEMKRMEDRLRKRREIEDKIRKAKSNDNDSKSNETSTTTNTNNETNPSDSTANPSDPVLKYNPNLANNEIFSNSNASDTNIGSNTAETSKTSNISRNSTNRTETDAQIAPHASDTVSDFDATSCESKSADANDLDLNKKECGQTSDETDKIDKTDNTNDFEISEDKIRLAMLDMAPPRNMPKWVENLTQNKVKTAQKGQKGQKVQKGQKTKKSNKIKKQKKKKQEKEEKVGMNDNELFSLEYNDSKDAPKDEQVISTFGDEFDDIFNE